MRVKSYKEAVRLALCAGEDAANRRMRKAGRKAWSGADHDHAAGVASNFLTDLGFDVSGWAATAGFKRNEPDDPMRQTRKRSRKPACVQLSFSFG